MDTRMDGKTLREIQQELDEATERRAALWRQLAEDADAEKSAEVARLNERIEGLWSEARGARARARRRAPRGGGREGGVARPRRMRVWVPPPASVPARSPTSPCRSPRPSSTWSGHRGRSPATGG